VDDAVSGRVRQHHAHVFGVETGGEGIADDHVYVHGRRAHLAHLDRLRIALI
jgi:hypothetical protein